MVLHLRRSAVVILQGKIVRQLSQKCRPIYPVNTPAVNLNPCFVFVRRKIDQNSKIIRLFQDFQIRSWVFQKNEQIMQYLYIKKCSINMVESRSLEMF